MQPVVRSQRVVPIPTTAFNGANFATQASSMSMSVETSTYINLDIGSSMMGTGWAPVAGWAPVEGEWEDEAEMYAPEG